MFGEKKRKIQTLEQQLCVGRSSMMPHSRQLESFGRYLIGLEVGIWLLCRKFLRK